MNNPIFLRISQGEYWGWASDTHLNSLTLPIVAIATVYEVAFIESEGLAREVTVAVRRLGGFGWM
jgi:hypothetical protein